MSVHDHSGELAAYGMCVTCATRPAPPPVLLAPDTAGSTPARAADPVTSHLAAEAHPLTRGSHREQIFRSYVDAVDGLTDEQACDRAGLSPRSSPWKRCSELREWGWIEPTGELRETRSGCPALVCRLTPAGRAVLGSQPDPPCELSRRVWVERESQS